MDDVPLVGGNVGNGVVRVGDTVRRPAGPWSRTVDAFLRHLDDVGYAGAPRSLGFDDRGRHVVEHVDGVVSDDFPGHDLDAVRRVGRLLRDLHDAAAGFAVPADGTWNVVIEPDRHDLVIHHDAAPWNLVRGPDRWVFIDWDNAGPGSRLWDLSYAAHGFVPLAPETGPADAGAGLVALADGYGVDEQQRRELADLLAPRIRGMYDLLADGHRDGVEPWARLWRDGHGDIWRTHAEFADRHRSLLLRALLDAD